MYFSISVSKDRLCISVYQSVRTDYVFQLGRTQNRLCISVRTYLGQTMYFSQDRLRISVSTVQSMCFRQDSTKYYFSQDKVWLPLRQSMYFDSYDRFCILVRIDYVFQLGQTMYFSQDRLISVRTDFVFQSGQTKYFTFRHTRLFISVRTEFVF